MPRATTSCSAIALFLAAFAAVAAPAPSPSPLGLFPLREVWNRTLDSPLAAPPAFADGHAFFPVEGGELTALSLDTGEAEWTQPLAPTSVPVAGGDLLFLAREGSITAVRQASGVTVWELPYPAQLAAPLVWDNGWLIAADTSGTLLALRATDGAPIWTRELGVPVHAPPALAADRVYAPLRDNRVVAMDVSTGAVIWERALGGPPNDMRALDERMYVGSDDNFLYCLMASTGEVAWRWRTGGDVIGVPVVDEQRVYFVSRDNVLRALDRNSGSQRWKRALPGRPSRGPVRAGDVLLVSGVAPTVSGFAMSDGSPATDIAAPGELAAAPFVSQQHAVPQVVIVARDIEKGTRVIGFRRTIDPPMDTPLPALPGTITITAPKTTEPEEPATPDDAVEPADPADATGSPRPPSDTPAPGC